MKHYYGTIGVKNDAGYYGRVYHYERGDILVEDYRSLLIFDEETEAVDDAVEWADIHMPDEELELG